VNAWMNGAAAASDLGGIIANFETSKVEPGGEPGKLKAVEHRNTKGKNNKNSQIVEKRLSPPRTLTSEGPGRALKRKSIKGEFIRSVSESAIFVANPAPTPPDLGRVSGERSEREKPQNPLCRPHKNNGLRDTGEGGRRGRIEERGKGLEKISFIECFLGRGVLLTTPVQKERLGKGETRVRLPQERKANHWSTFEHVGDPLGQRGTSGKKLQEKVKREGREGPPWPLGCSQASSSLGGFLERRVCLPKRASQKVCKKRVHPGRRPTGQKRAPWGKWRA